MPWPIRSTRFAFYSASPAANTPISLGTVPTGKKWLVKDWSVYNAGAASRTMYMMIGNGGVNLVWDLATVASAGITGNHDRHVVLNAGESLVFQSSTNQAVMIQISGAQLG